MKNNTLIFGKGYVGCRLREELDCEISDKKIYSFADAHAEIKKFNPRTVINCIGNVGRDVDECETDPDKTLIANTFAPIILAEASLRKNIRFIHISTGCIYHYDYSKDAPIGEDEEPDFFELFYSRAKIYSERALALLPGKYPVLILRIRVPLDDRPHPRNLLTKLIGYKKAIDLPNSVTYIPDFLKAFRHLASINAKGIYNVVNKGGLVYPRLLEAYKKYVSDFEYEVVDYHKLNIVRTNLILSTSKLENTGFKVRGIEEVLQECVENYLKY